MVIFMLFVVKKFRLKAELTWDFWRKHASNCDEQEYMCKNQHENHMLMPHHFFPMPRACTLPNLWI